MKFSIRDLFLVTAIAALAIGWWMNRRQLLVDNAKHKALEDRYYKEAQEAKIERDSAKELHAAFLKTVLRQSKSEPIRGMPERELDLSFLPPRRDGKAKTISLFSDPLFPEVGKEFEVIKWHPQVVPDSPESE